MDKSLLLLLGAAFLFSSLFLLVFKHGRRTVFLNRLHFHHRRSSGSKTPPRSLSPGKEKSNALPVINYSDTFPPSRRFTLAEIQSNLQTITGKPQDAFLASPPNSKTACLPLNASYLDAKEPLFTPCEFSTEEIKALGDFPDYSLLSGVPLPSSYPEFDITKALPRPYRPFRWNYHQTMSLTKLEPDWWIELENTYVDRIKQRQGLFAKHGKGVLDALPGSELVCKELMEMVLQFICARYPQYFRLDKTNMVFYNDILKTETDLKAMHPLHVLLNNVPEDFAITLRDPTNGHYVFRAGIICSSLGWNVATKIGLQLHEIHTPIPDYKEKMQFSMDRYFAKKPTDKAIQRGSWGLEVDQPLYMPPGDSHEQHRDVQSPDLDITRCHLRVDWQTLRRLPLSGGIVFNFKALFTPVESFRDEPFVPALVLKVLKEGKRSLMEYKNTWHTEHVVIPALEEYAREQVEKGLVPADWEPHTLEDSPWFPGWEEKWHREQGF
ncbi:hypothetical protein BU24DRAFT_346598 [Aaosphaeria arxii CBS 175.79]|uniref:HRQ family protein n=1 Tax=Aaosphaeria arxii CBS 175.79 TaxID=1450172 RepID=A0A6A5XRD0_9PLEO|nr:uncharacterized protein BU24DRAFT_346598 [Aaosphaeria arxii CBS 175.79]KAF2015459.1 hypothetical protein BU24DRAFT_346598 [Aaosphaeria arxii CBS 175.79]